LIITNRRSTALNALSSPADRQIAQGRRERSAIQRGDHRIGRLGTHELRRAAEAEDRRQLDRNRAATVAGGADFTTRSWTSSRLISDGGGPK